ncbi:hypothetical protein LRM36_05385 [Stenotrophomonas maltophilia]|nr:hypothetical protein [Stenotrophomonas maltophilia]
MLIAIGLLSVVGFIQLLMYPFVLASNILLSVAEATLRADQAKRIYRKQDEARTATEELLRRHRKEVPDGRG